MKTKNNGGENAAPIVKQFSEKVFPGFALDIGSGRGGNSLFLANRNFFVTAIDYNEKAICILQEKIKQYKCEERIKAIRTDIVDFPIEENHYSFICAINSLNFLSKKEFTYIIERIKKGLQKNGICVITLFTENDPLRKEIEVIAKSSDDGESFFDDNGRRWYYPKENTLKKLFESDFEILFYVETEIEDKFGHPGNEMPHKHAIARIAIKK